MALALLDRRGRRRVARRAGGAESAPPASASLSPAKLERVGDYIRDEIAAAKIPGAVILIQQHGHPVYFESFGVRDVASRRPMTPDTIFRLYSMSKPITSVAAMMLVEDGKLSLDDPVAKYIPAFADAKVGVDKPGRKRQSAAHARAAQAPDHHRRPAAAHLGPHLRLLWRQRGAKAAMRTPICSTAISTTPNSPSGIAKLPLAEQPGTRWDYGHSTDVLGRVIEVVSGQSLFQFEKQRLLDPLGMTETAFFVADAAKRTRIAEPLPGDRSTARSPASGIRPCRGAGNPAAPAWSAPSATTRVSRRCC